MNQRRGRRPGNEDTREALIEAARAEFANGGYAGATVRAIAARAGVDPAMINHHFGSKQGLFAAAVRLPFNPADIDLAQIVSGPREEFASRLLGEFLRQWDRAGSESASSMLRTALQSEEATAQLRTVLLESLIRRGLSAVMEWDAEAQWRASLVAAQLMGLLTARYVARFEPLASAPAQDVIAAIGPVLQRYLIGDVGTPPAS
ncbi:TetR family transcriptional regulator [Cumulibacter soli]|uniref:TetR/AcrR family transcriptional regulator n=1 Tax=Cumulibacter soli TaxID=2546344 RepID=UPI001067C5E1|nr:TetR family transcriptional regulator [Cumulibacter soli]